MSEGWIKLHRKIWDNPIVTKDADHLAVWIWLLTNATHRERDIVFAGKRSKIVPGEVVCGRKMIAEETGVCESKVNRILQAFKSEQQIEQRTDRQKSVISIVRWDEYQKSEQQNEQRLNNDRTTSEQRVNTIQECKIDKNERSLSLLRTWNDENVSEKYRDNLEKIRETIRAKGRRS